MSLQSTFAFLRPHILSVLRIVTALEILQHGTSKLLGFPAYPGFSNILLNSLMGVSGIIELIGGLLFLVGLFTRPVAFILCGFTAVAYFLIHASKSFFPLVNGGELTVLYCFVFLYFVVAGPGPWSIDAMRRRTT